MEKLKLISVRVDPGLLAAIDKIANTSRGFKRSAVINKLLEVVLRCADSDTIWRMLSSYEPEHSGYAIRFDVDRARLENTSYND